MKIENNVIDGNFGSDKHLVISCCDGIHMVPLIAIRNTIDEIQIPSNPDMVEVIKQLVRNWLDGVSNEN